MAIPWFLKYRPKHIKEIVGNHTNRQQFLKWLESWGNEAKSKKAVLLHGPAGTGKTVTVEAAARDLDYDFIEINASDERTQGALQKVAGLATSQGELFGKRRIILLDEIDGINLVQDRGAITTLVDIIRNSIFPIILTANDPWNPKIRPLRNICMLIEFKSLSSKDCLPYLKRIASLEQLEIDDKTLKFIIERNEGDMRSMINDLETQSKGMNKLTYNDVASMASRDRKQNVFKALSMIFNAKNVLWARKAIDLSEIDYKMLFEWVYENLPHQLRDTEDLADGMDALAKANIYFSRIERTQNWRLLPFAFDMMTAGVAMSKNKTKPAWVPMKFPQRIGYMTRTRRNRSNRRAIGEKVGKKCHLSSRASEREFIPYLRFIFQRNPIVSAKMAAYFNFDEEIVSYLSGTKKRTSKIISLLEHD